MVRPFRILGIQHIALGAADKSRLRRLWIDLLGLDVAGNYVSECENVDEDIAVIGASAPRFEIDLMQPLGLTEVSRTGAAAITRGAKPI